MKNNKKNIYFDISDLVLEGEEYSPYDWDGSYVSFTIGSNSRGPVAKNITKLDIPNITQIAVNEKDKRENMSNEDRISLHYTAESRKPILRLDGKREEMAVCKKCFYVRPAKDLDIPNRLGYKMTEREKNEFGLTDHEWDLANQTFICRRCKAKIEADALGLEWHNY